MINVFSVDLEDYYHVYAFQDKIKFGDWKDYPSRIEVNTKKLLDMLGDTKATFFVLGWVAEHFPELVKEVHRAGHEIGSHSYDHKVIYEQSKAEFRESVRKSKEILENLTGSEVRGFRAPTFSITEKTLWALEVLIEEGFLYDSSIFPIFHDRYGVPDAERFPFRVSYSGGELVEFPISTRQFRGRNIPIGGGGYTRLLPYAFTKNGIRTLNKRNEPAVFYVHPWEIDPDQPRISSTFLGNIRHYYNLGRNETKIARLLNDFRFTSFKEILEPYFSK